MANTALRTPAQSTPATGNPRTPEQALIGAYNAAGLAQSYLEKGSYVAARRKLVLALRDVEVLTKEGGAA